jgi:phenylpropionate dioxygenase-like ring-hydroxylating dioxygenase large terminal subunit
MPDAAASRTLRDSFWHLVCHRSELAQPGDYVRLGWLGDDAIAWRDRDEIVVFDNVCPHRGTRFLDGASGNAPLVCPYHGWSYRNGRLRVPPNSDVPRERADRVDLCRLRSAWCGEFLFASIAPRFTLEEQLEGVWDALAAISGLVDRRADFNAYAYECDWRVAVENALEPYHIATIHPSSLGELRLEPGTNDLHPWSSVWRAAIQDERTDRRLRQLERLFEPAERYRGYLSIYLFPFSMVSTTYGFSFSQQSFFPGVDPLRTNFYSRLLTARLKSPAAAEALASFFESTAQFNRRVFDEDHAICRRVHTDAWVRRDDSLLAGSELKVRQFRELYGRATNAG